jgi:hypothetical protein
LLSELYNEKNRIDTKINLYLTINHFIICKGLFVVKFVLKIII